MSCKRCGKIFVTRYPSHICEGCREKFEEVFEDMMYQAGETYGGVYLDERNFEKLAEKYLDIPEDEISGVSMQKVKISAKKGKIVIERI